VSDRAPHRSPEFIKFWVGQSVSLVGSEVSQLAMPLLAVLSLGASPGEMGVLRAVNFAPYLLSLPVGVLVDRTRRRPLLIGVDLLRALLLGSIPLAAVLGMLALPQLYVVAALSGALTLVFGVAYAAYLPGLVSSSRLMEANARLELSRSAAHAAGPGLAGALVQAFSAAAAILADAISFAVSAVCVWSIRMPEAAPRPTNGRPLWPDIVEGLQVVIHDPVLRATTLASMTWNLFSGGLLDAIYVLYLSRDLQLTPAQIASLFVVVGILGVVGALVWPHLVLVLGIGPSMILAATLAVLGTLCIPLVQGPPEQVVLLLSGVLLVIGFAQPMMFIGGGTLRQAFSPPELIGRVSASITFVLISVVPLGALLGGALGEAIGPRGALLVAGVGVLLTPLWLLFSPVRSLRTVVSGRA
jgi:predicted MFS family arabinose efflux permease